MNATNPQQRQTIAANNAYIQEAEHLLQLIAQNPEERMLYESRLKGLRDYQSGLNAERRFGVQEGIGLGIGLGVKQVAKNMLQQNLSIEVIASTTGLSIIEIENLRE